MKTLPALAMGFALAAAPAFADVETALTEVIGPGYARLHAAAQELDQAAQQDCTPEALRQPYQDTWDAWSGVDFFRTGPVEEGVLSVAISFWPDPKSSGIRAQQGLIDADSPVIDDAEAFGTVSVAMRGLTGLERLIYPSDLDGADDVLCRLRRATAADLAATTGKIVDAWPEYRDLLLSAGEAGNTRFLSEDEAKQEVFTQLVTGLEYLADTRLGRPLGTEDAPKPDRAEARAAGRSLANITRSLDGMRRFALALYPDAPRTEAAFDASLDLAAELDDPTLAGVATAEGRARVIALQDRIRALSQTAQDEIGGGLGVEMGFNMMDGD